MNRSVAAVGRVFSALPMVPPQPAPARMLSASETSGSDVLKLGGRLRRIERAMEVCELDEDAADVAGSTSVPGTESRPEKEETSEGARERVAPAR